MSSDLEHREREADTDEDATTVTPAPTDGSTTDTAMPDDTTAATDDTTAPTEDSTQQSATSAATADADEDMDRPRVSTVVSTTALAFAIGAAAIDATFAVPLLLLGGAGMAVGVVKRHRRLLDYATAFGLTAVLLHGAMGGSPVGTVLAAGLLVFAWDMGDHAFDLDAHLGTDANVTRGEVAHAIYSFGVVTLAGGGALAIAIIARSSRPLPALVLLLLGAILLVAALRDR